MDVIQYPYSPHGRFFCFETPPPLPPGNSTLASSFTSKILTFSNQSEAALVSNGTKALERFITPMLAAIFLHKLLT